MTRGMRHRRRRGAAMVEFAIVLPILILAIIGILEFGRAVMVQQIITNAAREGARRGVDPEAATDWIRTQYVIPYISRTLYRGEGEVPQEIGSSTVQVTAEPDLLDADEQLVRVSVSVPYDEVSYGLGMWFGGRSLSAQVTMRRE